MPQQFIDNACLIQSGRICRNTKRFLLAVFLFIYLSIYNNIVHVVQYDKSKKKIIKTVKQHRLSSLQHNFTHSQHNRTSKATNIISQEIIIPAKTEPHKRSYYPDLEDTAA